MCCGVEQARHGNLGPAQHIGGAAVMIVVFGLVAAQGLPTMEFYRQQILLGLKDYARRCGFKQVVVGSSGGIDSALTLALAVDALGAENVVGITMPSSYSSVGSVDDSVLLCRNLGIRLYEHPIKELVTTYARQFEASFGEPLKGLALENLQARAPGATGFYKDRILRSHDPGHAWPGR